MLGSKSTDEIADPTWATRRFRRVAFMRRAIANPRTYLRECRVERSSRVLRPTGGWGKVAAAASAEYAVARWHPRYLVNLGTCGGITGRIDRFAIVLVNRTIIYDIYEAM